MHWKFTSLLLLEFVCLMTATTTTITIDDCPSSNWTVFQGSCYIRGSENLPWDEARRFCEELNANLPNVDSLNENEFLTDFHSGAFSLWINLLINNSYDDFITWFDGTPVVFANYVEGEDGYGFFFLTSAQAWVLTSFEQTGYVCKTPIGTGCDDPNDEFEGYCYDVVSQNGSLAFLQTMCNDQGGTLASFHSKDEADFIRSRIMAADDNSAIIGLTVNNTFPYAHWSDGTSLDYFPSDFMARAVYILNRDEDDDLNEKWALLPPNVLPLGFVCEYTPIISPPPPPPPTITCNSSSVKISLTPDNLTELCVNATDKIVVSPRPFFLPDSDYSCVSDYSDASFYFNLTECYPDVEKIGNNLKFTWSVRKLIVADDDKPVVRFDEDKCLELCCWYDATELISSDEIDAEIRKITVGSGSGSGSFSIEMTLYANESLTTELTEDDDVEVPDAIYVLVELEIADPNERFVVQMEDCWATPSDNPCDPYQYQLVTEGCADKNDPGAMVEVTRNYKPIYGTFQFNSFLWVHDPEDPIYVHCKVRICDGYEYNCSLTCDDDDDAGKRDVSSQEKDSKDVFSYGPIYVHSNKPSCYQDNGGCSDFCSVLDNDVIECTCAPGKSLMQDGKNCQEKTENFSERQEMEMTMMFSILLLAFVLLIISGGMMWKTRQIKDNRPSQLA